MSQSRLHRSLAGLVVALAALCIVIAGAMALGQLTSVVTHGVSMNPVYYQGDLVIVAKADSYKVGDIAAYPVPGRDFVALHRIIAADADGFVMKGDNNQSIDPFHPTTSDMVGTAVLHVPHGGQVLQFVTNPIALGVVAFALVVFGGSAVRTRRRKRRETMAEQVSSSANITGRMLLLPKRLRIVGVAVAVVGLLGLVVAGFSCSAPAQIVASSSAESARVMQFSYTATVPRSPAYDGTTVSSPDPVFRKLTDTVDVRLAYQGDPGIMSVAADLSASSGWKSTVPLSPAADIASGGTRSVTVDLNALYARSEAAAKVIGIPVSSMTATVVATVQTAMGKPFSPSLALDVPPLVMSISGDPTVKDSTTVSDSGLVANSVGVGPLRLPVTTARILSVALLLGGLISTAVLALLIRRTPPVDEATAILQRYPRIATVAPIAMPADAPVIDVAEFATLDMLAHRCGELVLHWSRSDVDTFVILDEGSTYRYRIPNPVATESAAPDESDARLRDLIEAERTFKNAGDPRKSDR